MVQSNFGSFNYIDRSLDVLLLPPSLTMNVSNKSYYFVDWISEASEKQKRNNKVAADDAMFWSPWNVTVVFYDTIKADIAENSTVFIPQWSFP